MGQSVPPLGELETRVLRAVWELEPCTERRIWEWVAQQHAVARTTVLKTVQRLEGKGILSRVDGTSPVQFRSTLDEQSVLRALVGRFVDRVLGGAPEPLVAFLAGSAHLSLKDLAALKAIAKKLRKEEP